MKKNIIFLLFLFSITAIYALDKPTIMVKSNGYEQIENETKSCLIIFTLIIMYCHLPITRT